MQNSFLDSKKYLWPADFLNLFHIDLCDKTWMNLLNRYMNVLYNWQESSKIRWGLFMLECLICALQVSVRENVEQQSWRYLAQGHIKWSMR